MLTRETGGTAIGRRLREILHDTTVTDLDDRAEALIAAADRAQHIAQVVRPALAAGRPVVSDRSVYSTLAYQGYGRGLDLDELRRINDWAVDGLWPARVILLDAPTGRRSPGASTVVTSTASRRPATTSTTGCSPASGRWPPPTRQRWTVVDAAADVDAVAARIRAAVGERVGAVTTLPGLASVWDGVVGQPTAVEHLRRAAAAPVHAYLLVGPSGSTKHEAARAFAAALLAGDDDPGGRDARLALAGEHPDVHEVERVGAAISKDQAVEIVHLTSLAPVEGSRKVLILHDFHLLTGEAAARLLKSIEEPPPSTIFVVLADFVPLDLITISSRCVRIDFRSIPDDVLAARLRADGVDDETTAVVVAAAGGDLTRARLLAHDPALVERRRAFAELPRRLDGTGATVMAAVDELLAQIDAAAGPLTERQAAEVAELDARREQFGERGSGAQGARGAAQARAAPAPRRRAAQRARRARRQLPRPPGRRREPPPRGADRRRGADPRHHRGARAQPQRAAAAAVAPVVAPRRRRPVAPHAARGRAPDRQLGGRPAVDRPRLGRGRSVDAAGSSPRRRPTASSAARPMTAERDAVDGPADAVRARSRAGRR